VEPLKQFRLFEVWHLYRTVASDISPARLDSRTMAFSNLLDLLLKIIKIRPSLIQGSEPYDFPHGFWLCCVALLAAGILRRPYYFPTLENLPPESKFREWHGVRVGLLLVPLLRTFMRVYAGRAMLVFALNEGSVKNLLAVGMPIGSIHRELYGTWGVDLGLFSPQRTDGALGSEEPKSVLFIGRIARAKGIPELMEAFLRVRQRISDLRLSLIGEGPMVSDIRAFAHTHGFENAISILGVVPNQNLPAHIRGADVVVSPSIATSHWIEQVGMVNIQSIACGTPVITTNSGAIPEFIENGTAGIIVPEKDPTALAEAIQRLLADDELRYRLSISCRRTAELRYDALRNIGRTEHILLAALNRHFRSRTFRIRVARAAND
jgi:glycosyltransferase involved in cell wall biosynthesis